MRVAMNEKMNDFTQRRQPERRRRKHTPMQRFTRISIERRNRYKKRYFIYCDTHKKKDAFFLKSC